METKLHWEDIMSYFFKFTMELGVDWTTVKDCEYCKNLEGPKWRKWRKSGLHRKMSQNSSCCWWWCSVTKSCPSLCDPMDGSTPGFSVLHCLPELAQTQLMSIELMMLSNHLILCRPLLLLPSIFSSIRAFSNELALQLLWMAWFSINSSLISKLFPFQKAQ